MTYTGILNWKFEDDQEVANFYEGKFDTSGLLINEYLILSDKDGKVIDKLRWTGTEFKKLNYIKMKDFKPMSVKQECMCDLLSNPEIPIKILAGVAGSGKSKGCMTYGLYYVMKSVYSRFFVIRHNVSVGEKNGFLPGSKFEKIRGWLGFFEDNLDSVQYTIEEMVTRGTLDVDSPEFMKGRDIKDSWIMVDECEDLTEDQFKMIGERASAKSVMCFVGDYDQTTEEKYKRSCGLKRAIAKLAGNPFVGIVVFDDKKNDNVRSEVSKIFSYLY